MRQQEAANRNAAGAESVCGFKHTCLTAGYDAAENTWPSHACSHDPCGNNALQTLTHLVHAGHDAVEHLALERPEGYAAKGDLGCMGGGQQPQLKYSLLLCLQDAVLYSLLQWRVEAATCMRLAPTAASKTTCPP